MSAVTKLTAVLALILLVASAASAAGPDLDAAVSWLAAREGGCLDLRGAEPVEDPPFAAAMLDAKRAAGGRLWALLLPDGSDLAGALRTVAGRLAPADGDAVIVASRDGVLARVPALSGHSSAIDEAFEASRRQLAASLETGLVTFVTKLDEAERSRRGMVRLLLASIALVFTGILLGGVRSFGLFRQEKGQWEREDRARHRELVAACQERLQSLAHDPASYDPFYAELGELSKQEPSESTTRLEILRQKMDDRLAGSKEGGR